MPYLTTHEVAREIGLTTDHVYLLPKRNGFYPRAKARFKGGAKGDSSFYSLDSVQVLKHTFDLAPGETPEDKWRSVLEGFDISNEERTKVVNQTSIHTQQIATLADRFNSFMENFKFGAPAKKPRSAPLSKLPDTYGSMNPDEVRVAAYEDGYDPQMAYLLAVKRDSSAALEHLKQWLSTFEPGMKLHGNQIIDEVANINQYLGEKLRPKTHDWRQFRLNLLATKLVKEAKASGYLIVG